MDGISVVAGPIFVDTSAYFAATNRRDASHELVSALMRRIVERRHVLITTNFILAALHALLLTRVDRRVAANVLHEVDSSDLTTVERVTAEDERRAREIVFGYADKDFSLTDAISLAVMERLSIRQAFTLDRNFAQCGWITLDPTAHS
jgi:predicted nucleic acid-binding protein